MSTPIQDITNTDAQKANDKEFNFEKLRKQLEQEKNEKFRMQERLEALEKAQERSQKSSKIVEDDESDEPYIDQKTFAKKLSNFEAQLEEKFDKRAEEKARFMIENEKQQDYVKRNADFNQILSQENIQKFAMEQPAMAERMLRMPDNFDRQALLYEQIKALQSTKKVADDKSAVQQRIDQNRKSPFYQPSGVGASPYAGAGDFSPSGQKSAYDKLQELKSRLRL
jgi:hypothetical protein